MDEATGTGPLERLHDLGVGLAIDDFGEGFSSLSRLRDMPVEQLKIDRSFMREVPHNEEASAVVAAIIRLAEALGREVVAEGVETEEQRDIPRRSGLPARAGLPPLPAAAGRPGDRAAVAELAAAPEARCAALGADALARARGDARGPTVGEASSSPTRRTASSTPGMNDSRSIESCRIASVWPGPPNSTS